MSWRGSTDLKDRIFAALVYLLPWYYAFPFGQSLFEQFPIFTWLGVPLIPLAPLFSIPFADLIIFFVLYLAVVRNTRISHFIRYNTMQAILLDIIVFLLGIVLEQLLKPILGGNIIIQTLDNTIFLGTLIACLYSIAQSALGRYAEIPAISEAAYTQVRY
ncbi:Tic20 family protein [Gloeothece verrucosa]|uniref:Tic20 family protein n=1 Tax=Gloeothece verrucosa (strain PCC 7822) TaxID=497965 RepID=E0UJV2_GLOV7|nr:Tic20 family protein [Gloeothece verrucosa]ADN13463.1 conserved hypothetical protein [Gloeothece verrucosa PCC 7822]